VPSSSAWMTIRCRAVNLGWQVVSVSSRRVGVAPGLSGTGAITPTFDGSTISRPGRPSDDGFSASPVLVSPSTRYVYQNDLVRITIAAPALSLSRLRKGEPLPTRCPAIATLPTA